MSDAELAFILEALKMVATEGWKILPQYVVNPQTGQWRHHTCSILRDKKSLYSLRFHDGKVTSHERRVSGEFSYKYLINQIPTDWLFVLLIYYISLIQGQAYSHKRTPSVYRLQEIYSTERES